MEDLDLFKDEDFKDADVEDTNDDESEDEMFDEDNDGSEHEDDENESDDIEDDDSDEVEEEDEVEDITPKTYRIKTKENHQDVEVDYTEDELVSLIQQGKDYSRVKQQVQQLRDDPRLSFVESIAKENGMTVDQYIEAYNNRQYKDMLDELIEQGVSESLAQEIVDLKRQKNIDAQAKTNQQKQSAEEKDLVDFLDYYKKINGKPFNHEVDNLPDSIWQANASGTPLRVAYMEYLVEQKEEAKKQEDKKQKQEAKKHEVKVKAPVKGASKNGNGKSPKKDPMFDGLFED